MIYNTLLLIATLFALPKWLLQKKYKGSVKQRLGLKLPPETEHKKNIWIHMVSVGESRAMIPIYEHLKNEYPDAAIHLSSTTKTGHEEAKRSLPGAANYFFLPLDYSWTMRAFCERLKPDLLLLAESDFWYHLMRSVKERGGKVILLNGKISEKSAGRYAKFPSKRLFDQIDQLLVQNTTYAKRFQSLHIPEEKIAITGNLKLSIAPKLLSEEEKIAAQKALGLTHEDRVLTLASTHEHEEELILPHIPKKYKVLVAARHPERFARLKTRYLGHPHIIIVEKMGILPTCFQISELAIIGGSFIPGVGGHNIYEPIQSGIPVIFGPFMEAQSDLVELILSENAGVQTPAEMLEIAIEKAHGLREHAQKLAQKGSEALEKSVHALKRVELNQLLS